MLFCLRDDDTSYFTRPEDLDRAYSEISRLGPVSLAIIPFCRAGSSRGVPEPFRNRWTVHPLHENTSLVAYLRTMIAEGRYEPMLHGYHHDERGDKREFASGEDLERKASDGRKYLEDLLGARVTVFVPPHNDIRGPGLRAIERAALHLGGTAGLRNGWGLAAPRAWRIWLRLKRWRDEGGVGVPWVLDLGGHREVPGNAVTRSSRTARNHAAFDGALAVDGAFCAATHYWELETPSNHPDEPAVGEQLRQLVDRAREESSVVWRSVGEVARAAA